MLDPSCSEANSRRFDMPVKVYTVLPDYALRSGPITCCDPQAGIPRAMASTRESRNEHTSQTAGSYIDSFGELIVVVKLITGKLTLYLSYMTETETALVKGCVPIYRGWHLRK